MKHTIKTIMLLVVLMMGATEYIWAAKEYTKDGLTVKVTRLPNDDAGSETVSISGRTVTITFTPTGDYKVGKVVAEGTISPSLAPRRTGMMDTTIPVTDKGDNKYEFTIDGKYNGAVVTVTFYKGSATPIADLDEITSATGNYILVGDVDASGFDGFDFKDVDNNPIPFSGTLDGNFYKITNLSKPLFKTISGGIVKNITFEGVNISSGDNDGDAGAICCKANGASRIYNCGILPSSVERDNEGKITGFSGSSVGGTRYTGGLVGFLDGNARVINCYSYATITGGNDVGGIVGYNNVATNAGTFATGTMVMNCMFYGDITGGSTVSPVYGGLNINNLRDNSDRAKDGLNTFNYYAYDRLKTKPISDDKYNCALAVEDKYLNRFEFYRLLLNSNKKLAAIYATGSKDNAGQMAKWVLETADRQIANPMPYPVLKTQGRYPSIINIDADHAEQLTLVDGKPKEEDRNKGGKIGTLSITISDTPTDGGQSWPTGAKITTHTLPFVVRTDKDFDRFNYNYDKVQLPYYNDVGRGNYTENRVVTGWKITAITAVDDDPYDSDNYDYDKKYSDNPEYFDYPNYNFADRKSSNKDLYSVSGRVFSQGAYFDVPYGVTSITIEPYWGKAYYIADQYYDVVYKSDYSDKIGVTQTGTQVNTSTTKFNGQNVETSIERALNNINNNMGGWGPTVYDNALVLVGNLHLNTVPQNGTTPFTMMSVDADNDHEPDYSLIYHHKSRSNITPIRFDFLNIPGTAQAQKPNGASLICNFTIFKTRGWFEVTNTAFMYSSQLEYENGDLGKNGDVAITKMDAPLILLGGIFDQFVSTQSSEVNGHTIYIHVGSNVWINSFGLGTHSDGGHSTPHVPVSVTGGDYESFYLTGTYNANATARDDNAECYISGGHFGELAGAALEQIGSDNSENNGHVRWQVYDADIKEFYGGGINDAKPVQGNIRTDIFNSHVDLFCGGPKFGNMSTDKTVKTTAEGCTFGKYFGAGYGGNSISSKKYYDKDGDPTWATLEGYYTTDRGKYFNGKKTKSSQISGKDYGFKGPGVATDFDYEFFVWSSGTTGVRLFVKFVSFSLAKCNDVESTLKKCIINENFYGGGSLGKVSGTATSTLEDCTVTGDVFGAGYSATLPKIKVRSGGFTKNPNFNKNSGMFEPGIFSDTEDYTWKQVASYPAEGGTGFDGTQVITTQSISPMDLGSVGNAILTIKGTTRVGKSVYGGGEESVVDGNTTVNVSDGVTIGVQGKGGAEYGNVYGGGKGKIKDEDGNDLEAHEAVIAGLVKGNTNVTVTNLADAAYHTANPSVDEGAVIGTPTIYHNVYGGGAFGSVGDFNYDANYKITSQKTEDTGKATVNIIGGNIGTTGKDNGMVFGSSRGNDQEMNDLADNVAWVYDTEVNIGNTEENSNPQIKGSVYGGGENGHNYNNAVVNIKKGVIGIDDSGESEDNKDEDGGASYPNRGNVYGGGCGTDMYDTDNDGTMESYNPMAGIVYGTTTITMTGGHVVRNIYGAGAMGSVGKYTYDTDGTNAIPDGKAVAFAAGSGLCTINISGGRVGVDGTVGDGNVFGAARGDAASTQEGTAQVNNTKVTVSDGAVIWGSVYGGGEAGDVGIYTTDGTTTNTYPDGSGICEVEMNGGMVHHNVFGAGKGEANSFECKKAMVKETSVTISNGTVKGNVFGGGEIARVEKDTEVEIGVEGASGEEYAPVIEGNVFGAGAGLETHGYSALVRGNTEVTIQGKAKVEHNVYGGGEIATVGRYKVAKADDVAKDDFKENYPGIEIGMPYEASTGGECTVIIKDNVQIGPDEAENVSNNAGHVFGAGKGVNPFDTDHAYITYDKTNNNTMPRRMIADPGEEQKAAMIWEPATPGFIWEYYPNQPAYFKYLETLALATATDVTIGNSGSGDVDVKGSVYGGSESGFLQRNTEVKILGGCEIGTTGTTTFGNVFGGGRGLVGFDVAGRVKGNATVDISGGTTHGSVFGGGELGFVGKFTTEDHKNYVWQTMEDPTDATKRVPTGLCTVTITGATTTIKGNVFGAGKGKDDTFECEKAMVRETSVSISNGTVNGNVFGGGEVGRVDEKAKVEIGVAGASEGAAAPVIKGSVFGAGAGVETHGYSALVRGNTEVTVQGKAKVEKSVYGGGEIAAVGRYGLDSSGMPSTLVSGGECKVTIKDNSTIGPDEGGGVFGAGEGVVPHYYVGVDSYATNAEKPWRMMTKTASYTDDKKGVTWDYSDETKKYVKEYFNTRTDYLNFLQTLALATDTKVSIEGSTTVTGSVYGGSKSGFVQRYTDVKIQGGNILTTGTDAYGNPKDGNVFGGGKGLTGNDAAGRTRGNTAVTIIGGSIANDVYGGAALAKSNTLVAEGVYPTATVNLLGGTIGGDAYGGGLGNATTAADAGNTEVNLNGMPQNEYTSLCESLPDVSGNFTAVGDYYMVKDGSRGCVVNRVFGANNTNGSPKGDVNVHVYATQQNTTDTHIEDKYTKNEGDYDMTAVYGGGNLAAYLPTREAQDNSSIAHVVIEGCGYTSIETVYGGGNAASAPGTYVEVNSCYEINDVFGGGNGKDDIVVNGETKTNPGAHVGYKPYTYTYTYERDKDKTDAENAAAEEAVRKAAEDEAKAANVYGSGVADVELKGGVVHHAFGGSNSRGNVRIKGEATLNEIAPESCPLCVEEVYGAGNEADQDGLSQINLGCITYLNEIYGGAKNADVNSDVVLTIQSGRFDRVFGGNNIGGCIRGSITVNIEETGCHPIIIGQLYGGGNQAGYSIYGYKQDKGKWIGRESDDGLEPVPQYTTDNKAKNHPQVNAKSFTSIGEIYGGGFGESAVMVGNPTVNINVCTGDNASIEMKQIEDEDTGLKIESDESDHTGEIITINEGTEDEVKVSIPLHKRGELGAVGNVFGGGNAAKVVGDTNINIGTKKGEDIEFDSLKDNPETKTVNEKKKTVIGADIRGNVYGGGNNAEVTGDTHVTIGKQAE